MTLRSLLFVPGDRPDRMEKAMGLGADALILDLEDAVAPANKATARAMVLDRLKAPRDHGVTIIVRINPVDSGLAAHDLAAIMPGRPDMIMLPKAEGAAAIAALDAMHPGLPPIIPLAAETPGGLFDLGTMRQCAGRLAGLTWGAEDMAAGVGATANRDAAGLFLPPYQLARSLTLFAAHAAGVAAIDTVYPDIQDMDGLTAYAAAAARDGFSGMMAIHPAQVAVINAAFTPTGDQVAHARAIIDAFAANPGAGVLKIGGKMIDAPHVRQAERLLARLR
ncbi:citrate lyase subunit beta/citryl-CoA lyase [Sphingobium fontiphilum]|uniref:Citrate lyase subunit beta/citryl-CoA lyase n=1 Tax=Sphingobium fontiphilum TaxID=944425 RepID=A0A7W6GPA1_9SPHN|nr:CoA ester lyase [Sphingobium fontiphilum]MBB3982610.1 citrate lyase subunit beta/citryl-CoA lyase [Sphingobium fontiphilum]